MFSQNKEEIKLEWMYKGAHSSIDREEYLLGKSIDKNLEQLNEEEKQLQLGIQQPKNHVEHECIPPSIRNYRERLDQQVDINAKLQEDPLIAIKKREEEKRKQFLNNPVQLKKLQKALKSQKDRKTSKHRQTSSTDSDDNLDQKLAKKLKSLKGSIMKSKTKPKNIKNDALNTILMHKYNQLKNRLTDDDLKAILQGKVVSSSDTDDSTHSDEKQHKLRISNVRKKVYKSRRRSSSSSSSGDTQKNKRELHKTFTKTKKHKDKRYRRSDSSSEDETPRMLKQANYRSRVGTGSAKLPVLKQFENKTKSVPYDAKRKILSETEKERKRKEMMQNASWRDIERVKNVRSYKQKDLEDNQTQHIYNPEFLQRELLKSANKNSVESRIKANINNIQRSKNDMNRNFSKR